MTEVLRGLIVDVYRCARWSREGYDPTNNGPSGRLEAFTVVALTRDGEELEPLPRDLPGVYARLGPGRDVRGAHRGVDVTARVRIWHTSAAVPTV
jgi:hypothetical protein